MKSTRICGVCDGSGEVGPFPCAPCDGSGRVWVGRQRGPVRWPLDQVLAVGALVTVGVVWAAVAVGRALGVLQ